MVLPPSVADLGAAEAPAWLAKLIQQLELARRGILFGLRGAAPTQLGPVVRALSLVPPWSERDEDVLKVCLRAWELADVEPGSRVLLRLHVDDLAWLNLFRPMFASRELRVVLWADHAAFEAMVRGAPDFHDWITRTVDVPEKSVPDFAVAGLEAALRARAEVCWRGEGFEDAWKSADAAGPRIDIWAESYREMVEAMHEGNGPAVVRGVETIRDVWRVRMARAQAGHVQSWVVLDPGVTQPQMWQLQAAQLDWEEATQTLHEAGWKRPALVAAWLDLEPERIAAAADTGTWPSASAIRPRNPEEENGVEAGIVRTLRDLGTRTPTAEFVQTVADAGFVDVAASLAGIRWRHGNDTSAERLVNWLLELGEAEEADQITEAWVTRARAGELDAATRMREEVRAVRELPSWARGSVVAAIAKTVSDFDLFQQWRNGDVRAGNVLISRYREPLAKYLISIGASVEDAHDIVQDTFLRVVADRTRPISGQSFKSYVFGSARNNFKSLSRQVSSRRDARGPIPIASMPNDAEAQTELLMQLDRLRLQLDRLRPEDREFVQLLVAGLSNTEIAETLGIALSTVEKRWSRILRQLSTLMDDGPNR